jgi:hypothetical protein
LRQSFLLHFVAAKEFGPQFSRGGSAARSTLGHAFHVRHLGAFIDAPAPQPLAIGLDSLGRDHHDAARRNMENGRNMKKRISLITSALCFGTLILQAPASYAQNQAKMAKLEAISQQLNLTPKQKAEVLPILAEEGPKVEAIKNNSSLSGLQKMQQIRAIHQQTDPQMKKILSPAQYEKLKGIRQQAIQEAIQKRRAH